MNKAATDAANKPAVINSSVIADEQQLVTNFYKAGLIPAQVKMSDFTTDQFNNTVPAGGSS